MPTPWTVPSRPTATPMSGRDPVGRKYIATESGEILTTEDGKWIIAIDSQDTPYTTDRTYVGQTWDDLGTQTWDDLGSMTWNDLYTGLAPTIYTARTPI